MIQNILLVGGIGCLVFTAFLIIMAKTGIAAAIRDEEGAFKKNRNWKSIVGLVLFLSFLFGLLYAGNLRFSTYFGENVNFLFLWLNAFGIFLVVHIYDLLVLDYLVIVKWHPEFLNLPDTDYYRTIQPHVEGFVRGIPLGMVASLIAALLPY